jgi:carboxylate-amine ligase
VREVWWDIRPHPDFGTIELRMCDGLPSIGEVAAVAALAQSLVHHLDGLDDRGALPEPPRTWLLTENKWRAGRHGLDAALIGEELADAGGDASEAAASCTASARSALAHLVDELAPVAAELGCEAELAAVHRTLRAGASYERQRRASDGGTNLWAVVDQLARELATDVIEP